MKYSIFNKSLNKKLSHPKLGIWFTEDIHEAKELLRCFKEYLNNIGDKDTSLYLVNAENNEKILY